MDGRMCYSPSLFHASDHEEAQGLWVLGVEVVVVGVQVGVGPGDVDMGRAGVQFFGGFVVKVSILCFVCFDHLAGGHVLYPVIGLPTVEEMEDSPFKDSRIPDVQGIAFFKEVELFFIAMHLHRLPVGIEFVAGKFLLAYVAEVGQPVFDGWQFPACGAGFCQIGLVVPAPVYVGEAIAQMLWQSE